MTAFGVPDRGTLGPGEDNRERVVVVSSILLLGLNRLSGGSRVVVGERPVGSHDGLRGALGEEARGSTGYQR